MSRKKISGSEEHSPNFYMVKDNYDSRRWGKKAIKNAVIRKYITVSEYEEITGEPYEDDR